MHTPTRLLQHLSRYGRIYPNAWRTIDQFREQKGKDSLDWSDWCFCPLAGALAIVSAGATYSPLYAGGDTGVLGGLAAWRTTQGIYRFDETVFDAVWNTEIKGDLPTDILFRLPEWCCYIETPGKRFSTDVLHGFFVHLEEDANDKRVELRFVLDCQNGMLPIPLHLSNSSLETCLSDALDEAQRQAKKSGSSLDIAILQRELPKVCEPLVSLVLYLCSQASEIPDYENRQQPEYNRKQKRIYPPVKSRVWEVGFRLGAAIRRAQSVEKPENQEIGATERQSVRPHIRRAHWHGYWTGSRKENRQKFVLKWLPPIPVKVEADAETIPTVRAVK